MRRGSFSVEYAVFLVVVIAALIGMSIYVKRALMGRWRQVGDTFGAGQQFEPGKTVIVSPSPSPSPGP
jgi:Flp pilus assembly pilin Flp